jgi:hypothetical protein
MNTHGLLGAGKYSPGIQACASSDSGESAEVTSGCEQAHLNSLRLNIAGAFQNQTGRRFPVAAERLVVCSFFGCRAAHSANSFVQLYTVRV